MPHGKKLAWLAAGAMLIAVGADVPEIARPGAWLALTFLLRGWRGMPIRSGLAGLALAFFAALAIADRGSIPVGGPLYFVIVVVMGDADPRSIRPGPLDCGKDRRMGIHTSSFPWPLRPWSFSSRRFRTARHLGLPSPTRSTATWP